AAAAQIEIIDADVDVSGESRVERERERLHKILSELADWDNLNDEVLWNEARKEILKSTGGNPPPIVDPFAGGGAIPLEAQRLGLEAHASDLNPVAVLINRAMIELPPKFAGLSPVHPDAEANTLGWSGAQGLAEDVRRYGEWMRDEAEKRIGHLYPTATLEDGTEAPVIAWIWARTVTCPNPACGIEMPLVRSWWLGKKKGKEAYVVPRVVNGTVEFAIGHDPAQVPTQETDGTVGRRGAECVACHSHVELKYIRVEGKSGRMSEQLMAIVAQGHRSRVYLKPNAVHADSARVDKPRTAPKGKLPDNPRDFKTPNYGLVDFSDLFTNRQLTALTTFSDLVGEARDKVATDVSDDRDAKAYADAVSTYLACVVSRISNKMSTVCSWDSSPKMEAVRSVFARQALPMTWDFAEASPFARSGGSILEDVERIARAIETSLLSTPRGGAIQAAAPSRDFAGKVRSTDP